MKKIVLALILILSFANAGKLDFKEYGFSFNGFKDDKPNEQTFLATQIFKPQSITSKGQTNVNVMIQKKYRSMKEYVDISNREFNTFENFKLIKQYSDKKMAYWEYSVIYDGLELRMISKAFINKEGTVFLITGGGALVDWEDDEKEVRAVVDSFKIY